MTAPHNFSLTSSCTGSELPVDPQARRPGKGGCKNRRRFLLLGGAGALLLLAALIWFLVRSAAAEKDLQAAIDEADRVDPGWRLAELEARRNVVPDAQNASPIVMRVGSKGIATLNTGTVREDLWAIHEEIEKLPPPVSLTGRQAALLRARLQPLLPILAEARTLANFPEGRYPFNCSPPLVQVLRHVDNAEITLWLLTEDACLRAQDGDVQNAWVSCKAMLDVSRAFGDEPSEVAQSVRVYHCAKAVRILERLLAQGQVTDLALAEMQEFLQEERRHPTVLISLRGLRAEAHHLFTELEAGNVSLAKVQQVRAGNYAPPGVEHEVQGFLARGEVKPAHAWLLRHLTLAVEAAKRPGPESDQALRQLLLASQNGPELARVGLSIVRRVNLQSGRAVPGCACAALAAERYRLARGRWPASLPELVTARLLPEVPADPCDGKPLRYRPTQDGVVIYSIGPDGDGTGDALEGNPPDLAVERLEFRLWNVDRRRLAP